MKKGNIGFSQRHTFRSPLIFLKILNGFCILCRKKLWIFVMKTMLKICHKLL